MPPYEMPARRKPGNLGPAELLGRAVARKISNDVA